MKTTIAPRARRSVLYLPASNQRAIEKSRTLAADCIVFDLEDAVAPDAKEAARANIVSALSNGSFGARETVVRCNRIGTPDYRRDLEAIKACQPHSVLLPKVSTTDDIERFSADARAIGLDESIGSWFMIETAAAISVISQLVRTGQAVRPTLACLVVGTNDIAKETCVSVSQQRAYLIPWLMQIVLAAKVAGIPVLDGVWNDFKDVDGFELEARQSVQMGFDGKTLIHPSQIEPTNRLFSPDPADLAHARAIIAAFDLPQNKDVGVINLDGQMVERLHLEQAQRLLATHELMIERQLPD